MPVATGDLSNSFNRHWVRPLMKIQYVVVLVIKQLSFCPTVISLSFTAQDFTYWASAFQCTIQQSAQRNFVDIHLVKSDNKQINCQMSCECFIQSYSVHFSLCGFWIVDLLFFWMMSVQCPFYVVLLVIMHKKQCNVKRALASNTICVLTVLVTSIKSLLCVWDQKVIWKTSVKWDCRCGVDLSCFCVCISNHPSLHCPLMLHFVVKDLGAFKPKEFSEFLYGVTGLLNTFTDVIYPHCDW